jgi:hypothetical protein
MDVMFPLIFKGSDAQKEVFAAATEVMKQRINGDVDLINKLVPTWEFACRRITLVMATSNHCRCRMLHRFSDRLTIDGDWSRRQREAH